MELLYRFILGGTMVVLVTLIAQQKGPLYAGVISMFPAIFSTALFLVATSAGLSVARTMALSMIASLPILAVFCGVFYLIAGRLTIIPTLGISLAAWFFVAFIYVLTILKINN